MLLWTLIILNLCLRPVVPKQGVNYHPVVICDSSRGNAEPNHVVVLCYERSLQKKFSTWNGKNFYWSVVTHNRYLDLGNASNKCEKHCLRLGYVKSDQEKDIRQFMKEKTFLVAEVLCCNLSGDVALIVWFTTNGMCVNNNTIIYVARASNNKRDCEHDLYCCLLPRCEALRTCRSGFPIATVENVSDKWLRSEVQSAQTNESSTNVVVDRSI